MSFPGGSTQVVGRLLMWHGRHGAFKSWEEIPGVSIRPLLDVRGWSVLLWETREGRLGEPDYVPRPYNYHFLIRESGDRLLLAAPHADLVSGLLAQVPGPWIPRAPRIHIERLVPVMIEKEGPYSLGAIFARVFGFGRALRSVILYGADLGHATLVRSIIGSLHAYRVSLRKLVTDQEILAISSVGEISFWYSDVTSLSLVDEGLRFLTDGNFIDWQHAVSLDT